MKIVVRPHIHIYFFLSTSASFPVLYYCWSRVYPYLIMSTKRWGRLLTVQDSLVSLKKILWMAYEVNSKDNRKHGSYQIFLKSAKNSVLHFGKIIQWMIVLMRWCTSAFWLFVFMIMFFWNRAELDRSYLKLFIQLKYRLPLRRAIAVLF